MRNHGDYRKDWQIRADMLSFAARLRGVTGMSWSAIGKAAINDSAFLTRASEGANFTINTYQKVMTYMHRRMPVTAISSA